MRIYFLTLHYQILFTKIDEEPYWVKLKERTKIVAGPSEFFPSIIIVAT